jgi:hypothetical protein
MVFVLVGVKARAAVLLSTSALFMKVCYAGVTLLFR